MFSSSLPVKSLKVILIFVTGNSNSNSLVETGVGASTIILFFLAYKFKKKLYSFDYNLDKISLVRGIINEAIKMNLLKSFCAF